VVKNWTETARYERKSGVDAEGLYQAVTEPVSGGAAVDQEPLVREEIDAARKVLDELRKRMPVAATFWLKADEGSWELYIATDRVKKGLGPVYDVVNQAADEVDDPNFDPFRVKLIAPRHPLARAAQEVYQRRPSEIPVYIRGSFFGGIGADGVYLYPPPASALSHSK
jgi:hypothetical protein